MFVMYSVVVVDDVCDLNDDSLCVQCHLNARSRFEICWDGGVVCESEAAAAGAYVGE